MVKRLSAFLFALALCLSASAQSKNGHELNFKVNGIANRYVTLAFYLGDKSYIEDSAKADAAGKVTFKGEAKLDPGIYLLVVNKGKFIELLVNRDNQYFTLETDTADLIKNMKVKNSPDNTLFYEYLNFINTKQAQLKPLQDSLKIVADKKAIRAKMEKIDAEVKAYKNGIMEKQPNTFLAGIFRASWEPEVPESPKLANGRPDSTFPYRYFKGHFWDKFDFADERIIRTPILQNKIRTYLDRLTPQTPDSLIISAKLIGDKSKANKDVFKFVINHITNYYESSKTMCFDAVFVFMAQEYYLTKQCYWVDSTQLAKVIDRVNILKYVRCGDTALELTLPDTTGKDIKLSTVEADYTILYFWDPTCGHCKKETPYLVDFMNRAKGKGIKVYAVGSGGTTDEWKKIIREFKMDFVNVYDELGYRKFYDIYATPVIYLLDKRKVIRAKRLDVPALEDFLKNQYKISLPPTTMPPLKKDERDTH